MRKVFLFFSWALFATGISLTSIATFQLLWQQRAAAKGATVTVSPLIGVPAANTDQVLGSASEKVIAETADARPEAIKDFINRHNPKLLETEPELHHQLVAIADEFQFDFSLLPAIAMKESGMCKVIPENSFNCLGLGVHSRGTWRFESYQENFATAAKILKENYIDNGLVTPEEIMTKYTPNSPEGAWAKGVNQFMSEIKYNDRQKGREADETNVVISSNN